MFKILVTVQGSLISLIKLFPAKPLSTLRKKSLMIFHTSRTLNFAPAPILSEFIVRQRTNLSYGRRLCVINSIRAEQ